MRTKTIAFTTASLLAVAGLSEAQIELDGWTSFNSQDATFSGVFDGSFSDKIVIVATGEHGFNNDTGNLNGITYDGVSFVKAIDRDAQFANTDTIYADIWYLDNPGLIHSAGLIEVDAENRGNITVLGLSGTADGVGNVGVTPTDTRSINLTTSANSFVVSSFSMGGAGNTANVNDVTVDSPLTKIAALNTGSSWDGQVVGYENNTSAGTQTYSFTGGNTDGSLVIAAEFLLGPPPPLLKLQVNTLTGGVTLLGDPDEAVAIAYYEIKSDSGSLDTTGWNSLADQDFDGNGPADGSGNGWEEAGGSNANTMAEGYLLGNSSFAAGSTVDLGNAYNTTVDGQDLTFRFLTDQNKIRFGEIEYLSSILGDMDGNGVLDNADISAFVLALTDQPAYDAQFPDVDPDIVGDFDGDQAFTNADIAGFVAALTGGSPASTELQAELNAAFSTVPEPGSLALLSLGGLTLLRRRSASRQERSLN